MPNPATAPKTCGQMRGNFNDGSRERCSLEHYHGGAHLFVDVNKNVPATAPHTPGCGCYCRESDSYHEIKYCPTHAAAPRLLAALEAILDAGSYDDGGSFVIDSGYDENDPDQNGEDREIADPACLSNAREAIRAAKEA